MAEQFAISYGRAFEPLATLTGTGSRHSGVELDEETLRVRMGWAFRADLPRASIASAARGEDVRMTRGVHGWRGDWLVNGDGNGIVELRLDPPARAATGGIPIRLERLRVSLEDPDAFLAAIKASIASWRTTTGAVAGNASWSPPIGSGAPACATSQRATIATSKTRTAIDDVRRHDGALRAARPERRLPRASSELRELG